MAIYGLGMLRAYGVQVCVGYGSGCMAEGLGLGFRV